MKRVQVLPVAGELAALTGRPVSVLLMGILVFAWLPSAMGEQADNWHVAAEATAASGGESVPNELHWVEPKLPSNPREPAIAEQEVVQAQLLDPDLPSNPRQPARANPQKVDRQLLQADQPNNPKRLAVTRPEGDGTQLPDSEPPRQPKRSAAAKPPEVDVEPPADAPYIQEGGGGCEDCRPCPSCCRGPAYCWQPLANRVEARGEWLLWWGKGNSLPPLVTTGPSTTTQAQAGVLGAPGTVILFGNSDVNDAARSGARVTMDYWLTRDHSLGLEAQYFGLGDDTASFQGNSNSFPVLARPFYNTQTGAPDSGLIGFPGVQTGNVSVAATTDFQGVEALLRRTWFRGCDANLDFLVGYRYLRLSDDLRVDEFETFVDPLGVVPMNSTLALSDRFSTLNEFQGADLGVTSEWHCNRWNLGFLLKVGLGNTSSRVSINGTTVATEPTQTPVTSSGGFLAQASNSGQYQRNQFTMVPELGINIGFDLTPRLRLLGGYSLIYWSAVARTGDQIELNLTPPQFPPPQTASRLPEFRFAMTDYWAQGLNLGLDFRF